MHHSSLCMLSQTLYKVDATHLIFYTNECVQNSRIKVESEQNQKPTSPFCFLHQTTCILGRRYERVCCSTVEVLIRRLSSIYDLQPMDEGLGGITAL